MEHGRIMAGDVGNRAYSTQRRIVGPDRQSIRRRDSVANDGAAEPSEAQPGHTGGRTVDLAGTRCVPTAYREAGLACPPRSGSNLPTRRQRIT